MKTAKTERKNHRLVVYKTTIEDRILEICDECGAPIRAGVVEIGFYHPTEGTVVGIYGPTCARKYKVGEGEKY